MIKIIEEKPVPRANVICDNCGSLLEYGNADLLERYENTNYAYTFADPPKRYYFNCPVCGCKIDAQWINK